MTSTFGDENGWYVRATVGQVFGLLVDGQYQIVENMTRGRRLSAKELADGLSKVPTPVVDAPYALWGTLKLERLAGGSRRYLLTLPFWTESGPADFGLLFQATVDDMALVRLETIAFVPVDPEEIVIRVEAAQRAALANAEPQDPEPSMPDLTALRPVPERWRPALAAIIHRLVIHDYAGLHADGHVQDGDRYEPHDNVGTWIEDYPGHLIDHPEGAWAYSDHHLEPGSDDRWYVDIPLWTEEEGRSDLTLEATVWEEDAGLVVEIQRVHVM